MHRSISRTQNHTIQSPIGLKRICCLSRRPLWWPCCRIHGRHGCWECSRIILGSLCSIRAIHSPCLKSCYRAPPCTHERRILCSSPFVMRCFRVLLIYQKIHFTVSFGFPIILSIISSSLLLLFLTPVLLWLDL